MTTKKTLTTESGAPVADNQRSQTAGPAGPVLLQDQHLIEKLARFNRERIPERIVHARGSGAYGTFEVTADVTPSPGPASCRRWASAPRPSPASPPWPAAKGAPEAVRDPRGFAVKFYTEDGNYDLAGNNTPIFFIRDPLKFPDFIHSQKPDPFTNHQEPDNVWDFFSLLPRGHPHVHLALRRPRHPRLLPPHERLRLAHLPVGERRRGALLGQVPLALRSGRPRASTGEEAVELAGLNPESHQHDLVEAIETRRPSRRGP